MEVTSPLTSTAYHTTILLTLVRSAGGHKARSIRQYRQKLGFQKSPARYLQQTQRGDEQFSTVFLFESSQHFHLDSKLSGMVIQDGGSSIIWQAYCDINSRIWQIYIYIPYTFLEVFKHIRENELVSIVFNISSRRCEI